MKDTHFTSIVFLSLGLASGAALHGAELGAKNSGSVHFNRDIRPIMSDTCFHCHGPDKNSRKGGLRLDIRDEALKPAKSGEIPIVPGKPEESEIIKRIFTTDTDDLMPPEKAHKDLTAAQKETIKRWVAEGAAYEPHWAYTPLVRPPVPVTSAKRDDAIDAFILEKLAEQHIKPSPEADRPMLLRRLSLDLIGLPPSPAEVAAFVHDTSPHAYEAQVDRLLSSPHFGERWAVWWLDVARFTDTVGFHGDQNQRIFPYRDYVIQSFNKNKHFDQFTKEQLAGDLLPNPTVEQRIATGFNRLNMVTREGGAQPKEYLAKYGAERVRTVGTAWLGSTFACCECHDHKFDPISQRDFYSMEAFFADVKQWGVYASYGYTPNPELKGWTNDYPFPPEIQVDSPYLKQREAKVHGQLRAIASEAMTKAGQEAGASDRYTAWVKETSAFLHAHPDGWATSTPAVESEKSTAKPKSKAAKKAAKLAAKGQPTKAKADGAVQGNTSLEEPAAAAAPPPVTFAVRPDQSILITGKVADDTTVRLHPGTGWISSFQVELLPDEAHGGVLARTGNAEAAFDLKFKAAWRKGGTGKAAALPFHYQDADHKAPIYRNGFDLLGIAEGWKTRPQDLHEKHRAVLVLSKPLHLQDGDEVSLTLQGNTAGCVRVSYSPLAYPDLHTAEWAKSVAVALNGKEESSKALAAEAYLTGTGWDAAALAKYDELFPKLAACRDGKAWTMVTERMNPLTVHILPRGNWMDQSGPIVQPATPGFLPTSFHPADGRRATRLDLADWICSKENPLTARAEMNRLWRQFFGNGLSMVIDDLGAQGEPPSHPELLDWLGSEFRESGWDFKHMVKLIVLSHTYRQSSALRPELRDIDPSNRLLASQNPRRLDAEFVRDNALQIAGLLNLDVGGPSVMPYQPAGYYANLQFPNREYVADTDDREWRRGVYIHWQRTFLHPMLANFDAPMRDECTANRNVSNTPQQALTLLNDPTFVEAARVLAGHLLQEPAKSDEARLDRLYELALARPVKAKEKPSLLALLQAQRQCYTGSTADAEKLEHEGLAPGCPGANPAELAAWTTLCRVVLNLHETITRY